MADMVRQGDVLVRAVRGARGTGAMSPVAPENGRLVLAHGEATGHHHSFALADRVALFREDGSGAGLFVQVSGEAPAMLEHQEHTALAVSPGLHEVVRQRTYTGVAVERVAD